MRQHRPKSSHPFVVAYGLMVIVGFGSFAAASDVTITDPTPQVNFVDNNIAYQWDIQGYHLGFGIFDDTEVTNPFFISAGAPSNSIQVDATGRVGMGLAVPLTDLHILSPNPSPVIRLEASSPHAYSWDVEDSDIGFFIVDSSISSSPFGIAAAAPTNAFFMNSSGNVGYGTSSPLASVHIKKPAQASTAELMARFETSDDTVGALSIVNASATNGNFIPKIQGRGKAANVSIIHEGLVVTDSGTDPAVAFNGQKSTGGAMVTRPLVVFRNNNVAKATIAANGNVTATSFITASSRELKDKIRDLDSEKASSALRQLTPVEFVYKDDATAEPRVGFIAEDVPDIVAEPERKSVPVMDVVALLTRVVKDQDRQIEEQKKINEQLMKRLEALEGKSRD